jgi:hypothetical protein
MWEILFNIVNLGLNYWTKDFLDKFGNAITEQPSNILAIPHFEQHFSLN